MINIQLQRKTYHNHPKYLLRIKSELPIKNGKIVISDRFADSTFVYQGFENNYECFPKRVVFTNVHSVIENDWFLPGGGAGVRLTVTSW